MRYSFGELEQLWIDNGGSKATAPIAAAAAMAESSGDPQSINYNTDGSIDRGLWQINSVHGAASTFDVDGNAKAAIAISGGGSNWRPWCSAWSSNACSGTYLGSGSHLVEALAAGLPNASPAPKTSPTSKPGVASSILHGALDAVPGGSLIDDVTGAGKAASSPLSFFAALGNPDTYKRVAYVIGGGVLGIIGIYVIVKDTGPVKSAQKLATTAAKTAAIA